MSNLVRVITNDGAVLACAINSTDMVARAEAIHTSSATVTAAMGRLVTAAAMMGSMMKQKDASVTLRVSGGGPVGSIIAVSDAWGNARVTVTNPVVELPLNSKGKLDVGSAVGTDGLLSVIRDFGAGELQTGHCQLVTGEIGEDLTEYFASSEQIPTVCALGVLVNPQLTVAAAGGFLLQLLPGAGEDTIERIEKNLGQIQSVSTMLHAGATPYEILEKALEGFTLEIIDDMTCEYRCDCSSDRVERAFISLGREEVLRLAEEQPLTTVQCHFCDKTYNFSAENLKQLIQEV